MWWEQWVLFNFNFIFFSLHSELLIYSFNIFGWSFRMHLSAFFQCFSFQFSYLVINFISTSLSLHFKILNNAVLCAVSVHGFFLSIFIYGRFIGSPELSTYIMFRLCFVYEIIKFIIIVLLKMHILPLYAFEFVAFIHISVLFRLDRIRWAIIIIGARDAFYLPKS